ncbi:MAG: hypothetical protein MJZ38_06665 [archaeon]|nr:hypothetical protein [archaeon]
MSGKKELTQIEPSETTVTLLRDNLGNIGIAIPLSEEDLVKAFNWFTAHQESVTRGCSTTDPAVLATAIRELNPYDDLVINVTHLNRRLKGSE